MSQAPLFYLQLLADRKLNPAAVLLHVGEGEVSALSLSSLVADERFSAFAAAFPCLIGTDFAERLQPTLQRLMQDAGCQMMMRGALYRCDAEKRPTPPVEAHWLVGDWYLAPPAKACGNQAASRALSLKLLELVAADADTFEIEAIFRQDPVLAYHLLRLVNSLGVGVCRSITSFSQAILILGRQQLRRWLNLILFAANRDDYRSAMLMARVAARARTMELAAKASGLDRATQEHAFMAGMFSLLGVLFGMRLTEVLVPLKLHASLTDAVLRHDGEIGRLLHIVEKAERADDAEMVTLLESAGLSTDVYNALNLEAHQWMLHVIHDKQDTVDG